MTKKTKAKTNKKINENGMKNEIISIAVVALGLLFATSIYTKSAGIVGSVIYSLIIGLFGISAYIIPIVLIGISLIKLLDKKSLINNKYIMLTIFVVFWLSIYAHILNPIETYERVNILKYYYDYASYNNGGLIGGLIGKVLLKLLGTIGTNIFMIALIIITIIYTTDKSLIKIITTIISDTKNKVIKKNKTKKENKVISFDKIKVNMNESKIEDKEEIKKENKVIQINNFSQSNTQDISDLSQKPILENETKVDDVEVNKNIEYDKSSDKIILSKGDLEIDNSKDKLK